MSCDVNIGDEKIGAIEGYGRTRDTVWSTSGQRADSRLITAGEAYELVRDPK